MLRYGIPEDLVTALRSVSRSFRGWGAPAKVTRPLADGERLELRDRALEVQHRPGHSPSDTLFWDAERGILICADHLIAHISSNPLLVAPARRLGRAAEGAGHLPAVAGADPRAAGRDPAPGPRRADHRPRRPDRRALRAAPPPRREAARADRGAAADGLRARPGAVGQHRRHPGLPDPLRGRRPRRPADRRRACVREVADGDVVRFEATGREAEVTIPAVSAATGAPSAARPAAPPTVGARARAPGEEADADHRQPVRDDGLGPAQEPGRLRAAGPLRGRGGADRGAEPRDRDRRTRRATAATTSSSPSAATAR